MSKNKEIGLKTSSDQVYFLLNESKLIKIKLNQETIHDQEILDFFKTNSFYSFFNKAENNKNYRYEGLNEDISSIKQILAEPAKFLLSQIDKKLENLTKQDFKQILFQHDFEMHFSNKEDTPLVLLESLKNHTQSREIVDFALIENLNTAMSNLKATNVTSDIDKEIDKDVLISYEKNSDVHRSL